MASDSSNSLTFSKTEDKLQYEMTLERKTLILKEVDEDITQAQIESIVEVTPESLV